LLTPTFKAPVINDPREAGSFPAIYVTHKNLDQLVSWGSDITRVDIAPNGYEWSPANDESTPENTDGILDIAPAVSYQGQGLYVLYKSSKKSKIYGRFLRPDPDASDGAKEAFTTSVKCPEGMSKCPPDMLVNRSVLRSLMFRNRCALYCDCV
jgi:hypothetical protein